MDGNMIIYVIAGLAFLTIAGLGLALTGGQNDNARKRAKAIGSGGTGAGKRGKVMDENAKRRQKTQEMLESMRKQDKERRKSIQPQNLKARLTQAGLDVPVSAFWIFSLILGMGLGGLVYVLGFDGLVISGISFKSRPALVGGAFFVGAFGLPRVLLGFLTNGRNKKMINQFADALDIIVRGVKSGLPLNESVRIISRESPEPLRTEFAMLSDNLAMGAGLERSLGTFYKRVPLQEVNFFMIVLMIQSKAGGNLSEALGNLSSVIRARKMMREKVKAMSSEAKASAMIIGALPFVVGFLVYLTTPAYIMQLFTTDTGHLFLTIGAVMMSMGIFVMRKMINFDL
ncbi:type II secretion system F family protein [Hyphomonas sp.]|uniref:type II secretion system F family protein n=1 Tax=Hyphomonas sp. TaxID=87 RepID=UPI0025C6E852|nr:type II secretion system F family protein [Hyphomonas sp.]